MFQGFNLLLPHLGAGQRELPCSIVAKRAAPPLAAEALDAVGWRLRTTRRRNSAGSSSVAIARAIVTRPAVLLADEPTRQPRHQRSREIMDLLTSLNRERGITVLMVTHEPDMAVTLGAACALSTAV